MIWLQNYIKINNKKLRCTFIFYSHSKELNYIHQLYHNFIRLHKSLGDCNPAEASGNNYNLGKNKWLKLLRNSIKNKYI